MRIVSGDPPRVEKRGPPEPLAREAAALRLLAGHAAAPVLVAHRPGVLVTALLPGAPRPLATATAPALVALGRTLRALHDLRSAPVGGPPGRPTAAAGFGEYLRARAADAAEALGPGADADRARLLGAQRAPAEAPPPFALVHGDLVEANIVWCGDAPRLVDWEFWRMGDPAEDLAYLAELNGLGARALAAVLEGYGDASAVRRVPLWRPLLALEAGAWYRAAGEREAAERLLARGRRPAAP